MPWPRASTASQVGVDLSPRTVEGTGRRRVRHLGLHRPVQPPPSSWRDHQRQKSWTPSTTVRINPPKRRSSDSQSSLGTHGGSRCAAGLARFPAASAFVFPASSRTTVALRGGQRSPAYHCAAKYRRPDRHRPAGPCGPRCGSCHRVEGWLQVFTADDPVDCRRYVSNHGACADDDFPSRDNDNGWPCARSAVLRTELDTACAPHEPHNRMRWRRHHGYQHQLEGVEGSHRRAGYRHHERRFGSARRRSWWFSMMSMASFRTFR